MFIDDIDKQHPERVLSSITLEHNGFAALFDLSHKHYLKVRMHIYVVKNRLEVYETAQETSHLRVHMSIGDHHIIDGSEADILPLLRAYLKQTLGDLNEHGYEGSFAGMLLEQALREGEVSDGL